MKKKIIATIALITTLLSLTGCSMISSKINDLQGSLAGNGYNVFTYDNYGNLVLSTSGDKISITGNKTETVSYDNDGSTIRGYDLSSIITLTIDGKEIQSCGDTCIFEQDGLDAEVDFSQEVIESQTDGDIGDNAMVARFVNNYKNMFGKSRVVVVKSQLGSQSRLIPGTTFIGKSPKTCLR